VRALFQGAERRNLQPLLDFLVQRQAVNLIGKASTKHRAPTVSFTVEGREPAEIAAALAAQRIGIANGNCYAYRLMSALGLAADKGVVRLSFVHYTKTEELDRLMVALDQVL
jgi:selenocysteine lyase/cysteine desulfurase